MINKYKVINKQLIYISEKEMVSMNKNHLEFSYGLTNYLIKLPFRPFIFKFKLLRRLFRCDIRCFEKIRDKYFFFFKSNLYVIDENRKIREISKFNNMSSPLYFRLNPEMNTIFFGDYSNGDKNAKVNIYSIDYSENIKVVATFDPGCVKHIHNIHFYDGDMYVLTGDDEHESGIWKIINGKPVLVLGGSQNYRSCFLYKRENDFIFLTDSPLSLNYLTVLDSNTKKTKKQISIPGPCINALINDNFLYFATSVEPNPMKKGLFNNFRVSKYITDKFIHIFKFSLETYSISEVFKFKKDFYNMKYFGLGNAKLIYHVNSLYIVPFGNNKLYEKTIKIKEADYE